MPASLDLKLIFKEFTAEDGIPRFQCLYCGGHLMEAKNRLKHISSVPHRRKVANHEDTLASINSSAPPVTSTPAPAALPLSPANFLIELHDDLNQGVSQCDVMDWVPFIPQPQEEQRKLIPEGTDVGFGGISYSPALPETDWEDFLYQSMDVDPFIHGYVGKPQQLNKNSSTGHTLSSVLLWFPFRSKEVFFLPCSCIHTAYQNSGFGHQ